MPWCPKCKAEYREGFTECSTCHVPLVDTLPEEKEAPEREKFVLPDGMEKPIAVYTAQNRLEAETICDLLYTYIYSCLTDRRPFGRFRRMLVRTRASE